MSDHSIALLPDHVANQIAAGEVVQRPASVVKELLENAIDAGATLIRLIIKDAGKTLIQVTDNGKGMNAFDARLCFERHATSKISSADDLFSLSTKGFRGEALASIAAIAQVELRTRRPEEDVAQKVVIEGGKFLSQEECQAAEGSSFTVKNLFYNVPARRNFLKSDQVELRHIMDELERVAIPHTNIHFIFNSNGNEVLNLPAGGLMQRIKGLLGAYIQKELVAIEEATPFVSISGYVCLPNAAVKARKDQYFFVNNRFIRNAYLNHAVYEAYKDLIGYQSHPKYFLFLELDPKHIDINIHPTKTEIKFTDDKTVYMTLVSAIRRALGKANAGPSLDFETEAAMQQPAIPGKTYTAPPVSYNTGYNPFNNPASPAEKQNRQHWESLFEGFRQQAGDEDTGAQQDLQQIRRESVDYQVMQLNNKYIVTLHEQNVLIVDQQRAHERILYEHYIGSTGERKISSQQLLFPEQVELSAGDFGLVTAMQEEFLQLGFDLSPFGKNSIVVNGTPSDMADFNIVQTLEGIIETFKLNTIDAKVEKRDNLCRAIARNLSIRYGKRLEENEMKMLLNSLMEYENPLYTAGGKVVMMEVGYNEIEKFFKR